MLSPKPQRPTSLFWVRLCYLQSLSSKQTIVPDISISAWVGGGESHFADSIALLQKIGVKTSGIPVCVLLVFLGLPLGFVACWCAFLCLLVVVLLFVWLQVGVHRVSERVQGVCHLFPSECLQAGQQADYEPSTLGRLDPALSLKVSAKRPVNPPHSGWC